MKNLLPVFYLATFSFTAGAQQFSLIKDIYPGTPSSNICYLTDVDNTLFFAANDGVRGMELWKTDGTEGGTVLVKDIYPGSFSSSIGYLTHVNRRLFFVANNGTTGTELWKSDGTTAGTELVKDIRPGAMGCNPSNLVNVNGTLFFSANDGVNGVELWKSDGTAAGTVMIKDINPLSGSSYPQAFANVNGTLFFAADNGVSGMELWKSDGTAAGTVLVRDIRSGANGSYPFDFTNVKGTLYFSADDGVKGTELWKSDGSAAGTVLVKDIRPGAAGSYPLNLKSVDGNLFFSADDGVRGSELWKSDGSSAGTLLVKDIWPGPASGIVGNFSKLFSKLIFTANDGVNGNKAWQSDGYESSTVMVTGVGNPGDGDMRELVETDNNIYASIRQTSIGRELWAIKYSSVLPLELLEFKGQLHLDDAVLTWITGQEINTQDFVIERSWNGTDFTAIGVIKSANTAGTHHYTFTDQGAGNLNRDRIYYRLKQRDIDSRYTYSKVISLIVPVKTAAALFPNPASTGINLSIVADRKEKMDFRVFDNAGRKVMRGNWQVFAGTNQLPVDISRLPDGVYYINLLSSSGNRKFQFIKR